MPVRRTASPLRSIRSLTALKPQTRIHRDLSAFLHDTFRQDRQRISTGDLRRISKTVPFQRALRRISNGVLTMPWSVLPPKEFAQDPDALAIAERIKTALQRPNREDHNLYSKIIQAIIDELMTLGVAAVERQPGKIDDPADQPFWLFLANAENIRLNPDWSAAVAGIVPRYYDFGGGSWSSGIPIMDSSMFLIQRYCNAYEINPASPLEIAYWLIQTWLGLGNFQQTTTSQAVREYILVLKGADQNDVEAFRQYWEADVEGSGKIPIIGGDGVDVVKLGARNDDELYLRYTDYILRIIAIAFDLASRDFGVTDHDNRATAGVAADTVFQDAILPMALCIKENFQLEVIDYYYPGYQISITDTEPRSEEQEASTAAMLFEKGVISRNEARIRAGHDAQPSGDVYADGAIVQQGEIRQDAAVSNQGSGATKNSDV